jgi:hypothetical protein
MAQVTVVLTSGTFWKVPDDWSNNDNTITLISGGGGSSGSFGNISGRTGSGGGGGACLRLTNYPLNSGATVTYAIGAGGTAGASGGGDGGAGGTTTFDGYSLAGGGAGGNVTGGTGGAAYTVSGYVTSSYAGGNGLAGVLSSLSSRTSGGGGAAGPSSAGGSGSTSNGGTAGTGLTVQDINYSGAGGYVGEAKDYGGGGGGQSNFGSQAGKAGAPGVIVITYFDNVGRKSGYAFPILNSDGTASSTVVDFDDMFVSKELFLDAGIYSWGLNNFGQLGQGTTATYYSSPVQVGSLTNWKQVSNSNSISAGVKVDGTLWTWGRNSSTGGQLGLGNNTSVSSPNQVGSLYNWKQVVCGGFYMLAIKTDGTLWAWGNNGSGQLGVGNRTYYSSPVQVGTLTNWKSLSIGAASGTTMAGSMAIKTDGTLWGWGSNIWGNLGINSSGNYFSAPVQVGSLTSWKQVATGGGSPGSFSWTLAIQTTGTLWAWGSNSIGQLGINSSGNYYSNPIQVGTLTNWKQITGGGGSFPSFAGIKTDGTLWVWGNNAYGQLGQGFQSTTIYYSSPIQVGSLTNWKQVSVDAGSGQYMSAIKTDGTLWTWGINTYGSLGTNVAPTTYYSSPVQVGALTNWKQVTVSDYHGIAISSPDLP